MAPENFVRAVTLIGAAVYILATLTACSHQAAQGNRKNGS
jgi:hypothetical protein